jgi:hypothetical protein
VTKEVKSNAIDFNEEAEKMKISRELKIWKKY